MSPLMLMMQLCQVMKVLLLVQLYLMMELQVWCK
jgi:hypothetical protein